MALVGLAFFLSWEALSLRSYLREETRPPSWGAAASLSAALDWREGVPSGAGALSPAAPVPRPAVLSPLYYALLARVGGGERPLDAALWLNWFYLALLSVAVFGLAWHFRPDETALLSVAVLAGSPALQELFHSPVPDLSLAAWVASAYWALLRSDEFRRWPGAVVFGLASAAGLLHDWSFITYLLPAFYMGLLALGRQNSRLKVLAACALALAGALPWYAGHAALVVERVVRLPAISPASLVRSWAVLGYLGKLADGLGPAFFACGLLGLCFPQYRRNWHRGWALVAWFVASYLLWCLAPVPQLRYLVPCLPALAVAGLGAWPRPVLWALAAIQLFTLANFQTGWLSSFRVPLPAGSLMLFPSQPPARQDWHVADILRQAQSQRDPRSPFAVLTLVANDTRFNRDSFELVSRWLKIGDVRVAAPTERLCEFSQFVVLKEGSLGPERMLGSLPEAAKAIKMPGGWFQSAYEEAGRWPLPDGSAAVLYRQRRPASPPVKPGRYDYQFFSSGGVEASNLALEVGGWDPQLGVFRKGTLSASELRVRGLRLTGLKAELEDVLFQPIYERGGNTWGDVRLLKLGLLRIKSLKTDAASVRGFIESRVGGLKVTDLALDRDVRLSGRLSNVIFSASGALSLETTPPALRADLVEARLGGSVLPPLLLAPWRSFTRPLSPTAETPFAVELPGLTVSNGWLTVP